MYLRKISIITVLFLLAFFGCAKKPARVAKVVGERTDRAIQLENSLRKMREVATPIKALARMELNDSKGMRSTEAAVVIAQPNRIRIDAMDSLADVWAKIGSDGKRLWLYLPGEKRLYEGRASRKNLNRIARFDLGVSEFVSFLSGTPPYDDEILNVGSKGGSHFTFRGEAVDIWTEGEDDRISRVIKFGQGDGEVDYEIAFSDYRMIKGVMFPHRISAYFPKSGARTVVEYIDVSFGDEVSPSVFIPPKRRSRRLSELKENR